MILYIILQHNARVHDNFTHHFTADITDIFSARYDGATSLPLQAEQRGYRPLASELVSAL